MAPPAFHLLSEGKVQPAIKPSLPSCVLLHSDDDVRNSRDPSLSSLSPRALLYEVHKVNVFLDTLPCHLDSATASVHGETLQTSYVVATFLPPTFGGFARSSSRRINPSTETATAFLWSRSEQILLEKCHFFLA